MSVRFAGNNCLQGVVRIVGRAFPVEQKAEVPLYAVGRANMRQKILGAEIGDLRHVV